MEIPESYGREIKRGMMGMGANTGHAMEVLLLWAVGVTPGGDYGRQCRMLSKVTLLKKQDGMGIYLPASCLSLQGLLHCLMLPASLWHEKGGGRIGFRHCLHQCMYVCMYVHMCVYM